FRKLTILMMLVEKGNIARTTEALHTLEENVRGPLFVHKGLFGDDVTVFDEQGNSWTADILVGCDGVKSVVRQSLLGDAPRVTGH
ncbi:hypothetical protein MJL33_31215, partial [Salmonella enterica subsp. enterica serovar Kentucky]|nr:hypothetical protein [Salmonella enterica subsp. enterica serovar Kentucky]